MWPSRLHEAALVNLAGKSRRRRCARSTQSFPRGRDRCYLARFNLTTRKKYQEPLEGGNKKVKEHASYLQGGTESRKRDTAGGVPYYKLSVRV